jgi:hypothetical protein
VLVVGALLHVEHTLSPIHPASMAGSAMGALSQTGAHQTPSGGPWGVRRRRPLCGSGNGPAFISESLPRL